MITGGAVETTTSASLTQVLPTYLYAGAAADHGLKEVSSNTAFGNVATPEISELPLDLSVSTAYFDDAHQIDRRVLPRPPNDAMRVPATYPSSERSAYTSALMPIAQSDRNLSEYLVPGQMDYNRVVPPCLPRPSAVFSESEYSEGT
ncbi:hypothetical protein QAD02_020587 [Eretmocerus hayati]|uniref:Uncharacterized protein n=1 Tax=Eretmocerus hayati TaxID=131215 RepID=A0ACC2PNC0_9HYME|nr:hypothetical protein QAD02_020587 [Eretmocerus hayati]